MSLDFYYTLATLAFVFLQRSEQYFTFSQLFLQDFRHSIIFPQRSQIFFGKFDFFFFMKKILKSLIGKKFQLLRTLIFQVFRDFWFIGNNFVFPTPMFFKDHLRNGFKIFSSSFFINH